MRRRHIQIDVRQYADGRWGFNDYSLGRLKKVRLKTKSRADERALDIACALENGRVDLLGISRQRFAEFLAWEKHSQESLSVPEGIERFNFSKGVGNLNPQYLRTLAFAGNLLKAHFPQETLHSVNDVAKLSALLGSLGKKSGRRNAIRDSWATIFRYWRRQGLIADATTAPERLDRIAIAPKNDITLWTPLEAKQILLAATEKTLPYYAIGLFAGLRPYEIMPPPWIKKDGLLWEDFNWRDRVIHVRAEVAKGNRPRNVPILPALRSWLSAYRTERGRVARFDIDENRARLLEMTGLAHRNRAERHSFITYRVTITKNIFQVSLESGNSPRMIETRYYRPRLEREARNYFGLRLASQNILEFQKSSSFWGTI